MLCLDGGAPLTHASDVFAMPWENLFDAARKNTEVREVPLWSGLRLQIQAHRSSPAANTAMRSSGKALRDVQTEIIRKAVVKAWRHSFSSDGVSTAMFGTQRRKAMS